MSELKYCTRCGVGYGEPLTKFFHKKKDTADGLQQRCKKCISILHKQHYLEKTSYYKNKAKRHNKEYKRRNQEFMIEYLSKHPCIDCGETNPLVLEFDHRDNKSYDVSTMCSQSIELLQIEIDKCDVRCSSCHRLKTAIQFGWYKNIRPEILNLILEVEIKQKEFVIEAYERDIRNIQTGKNSRGQRFSDPNPSGANWQKQQISVLKNQINKLRSLLR